MLISVIVITMVIFLVPLIVYLITKRLFFKTPPKSINNKHVVVTGGSSGIGKSVAILAAQRGAHVTIIARNPTALQAAVDEIKTACVNPSQKVQQVSLDVTDYGAVERTFAALEEEMGPIFMLVACAGFAISRRLEEYSEEAIRQLTNVNVLGTIFPTKALAGRMKARREGVIVLTGSQASLVGIFGFSVYSATKFAVRGFAESLHMEMLPYNVGVTVALPPDTDTPGFEAENRGKPEETLLISGAAGLFKPEVVARKLLQDALEGNFFSYVGMESFMLTTLSTGMSPFSSIGQIILEFLTLGWFRVISCCYLRHFHGIIRKCALKRTD